MGSTIGIPLPRAASISTDASSIEVYILYKQLGKDAYSISPVASHHILLLKTSDGQFYYTDLQTEDGQSKNAISKQGRIRLRYGEYMFYRNEIIYYRPVGHTKKTLAEIQTYVQNHDSHDTIYGLFNNNCQHYVRSVVEFLDLIYPSDQSAMKSAKTHADIDLGKNFNILSAVNIGSLSGPSFDLPTMILNMKEFTKN